MNIRQANRQQVKKSFLKDLNESQQIVQAQKHSQNQTQQVQDVFEINTNQFIFDCGIIMANVNSGVENPFGLIYYIKSSENVSDFLNKIQNAIDDELTDNDISKLKQEYSRI